MILQISDPCGSTNGRLVVWTLSSPRILLPSSAGLKEVALTQIAAADKVCFVPGHPQLLLVEGCPDARNIWTYIVDLEEKTARQFPSTEGILRFSASGDTLILGAYRYHEEGGRYSVAKTYTLASQFIKEEETEEY